MEELLDQENLVKMEEEYYSNRRHISIREWEQIFPEAKEVIRNQLREVSDQLKDAFRRMDISVKHYTENTEARPIGLAVCEIIYKDEIVPLRTRLKRLMYEMSVLERKLTETEQIDVEQLKNSIDLRDVMARYGIPILRRRKNDLICCPFHGKDNHPSFSISERLYYCFSCNRKGDVIKFVQEMEGIGFKEALNLLK